MQNISAGIAVVRRGRKYWKAYVEWEDYMAMFQQCKPGATSDEKWQEMQRMFYLYE